ncbi:MAG TPA: acyl-CoA dehydrogenase family protein, partial [Chroococcales cyanobacterium]
ALQAASRCLRQSQEAGELNADLNGLSYELGDLKVFVESARALTYEAARRIDAGNSDVKLAAMAKVQATDAAVRVSTEAISLAGERGLEPDLLLERIFRDSKAGQIYEGTNQIQRMVIVRQLLK